MSFGGVQCFALGLVLLLGAGVFGGVHYGRGCGLFGFLFCIISESVVV